MNKIKGIIDRFEGNKAVIRYNDSDIILEKDLLEGFSEGDSVVITVSNEKEDLDDSNKVARELLAQVLKGE